MSIETLQLPPKICLTIRCMICWWNRPPRKMFFSWLTMTCGEDFFQYFIHKVDYYILRGKRRKTKINIFTEKFVGSVFWGHSLFSVNSPPRKIRQTFRIYSTPVKMFFQNALICSVTFDKCFGNMRLILLLALEIEYLANCWSQFT